MPEHSRLHRITAGLAALTSLAVLVAGAPLLLWNLAGWPLPHHLPTGRQLTDLLGRNALDDATLVKVVTVAAWLAWLQVIATTTVEIASWARGRPARRIRTAGALQPAIRRLVATAAMLISTVTTNVSVASASTAAAPTVLVRDTRPAAPAVTAPDLAHGDADATAPTLPTYVVQRRDTLWGLSETHLGDPFRWRDVFTLNEGVPQADGGALTDPNLIRTGWTLTFPADAAGLHAETRAVTPATPTAAQPTPAATDTSCVGPTTATVAAPTVAATPDSTATTQPVATTVPPNTPDTPGSATPAPAPGTNAGGAAETERVPLPIVGGGLLAASLLVALTRLRRVQQRRRRTGQPPRRPRADLAPVETAIRTGATVDDARLLDLGLRAFLNGIAPAGDDRRAPAVHAVRILDHRLEILLDQPLDRSPEGFEDLGRRRVWRSTRSLTGDRLTRLAAESPAPLPALVALGIAEGGEFLVDIETAGLLTVTGPTETAHALLRRIATELATSTWADHLDVLTADPHIGNLTGTQRIHNHADIDDAIDELAATARQLATALDTAGHPSTLAGRTAGTGSADWTPSILVHAGPLTDAQIQRLCDIVDTGGRGVGAVIVSDRPVAPWTIAIDGHNAHLTPLGIAFTPHLLNPDAAAAIDELLTDTAVDDPTTDLAEGTEPAPPYAPVPETAVAAEPIPAPLVVDPCPLTTPFDVEVRVLGTVDIVGARVDRRRVLELIAYLSLHPEGVTDERLKTALWPEQVPSLTTFNTTVSQARNSLGRRAGRDGGGLRFLHVAATGGLYRLDPSVTCDATRFEAATKRARRSEPREAMEMLRAALELVRGMPFTVTSGYEWAHTEGLIACHEAMVADAAHRLATLCLDRHDPEAATWAAMQGLKASPGNEILYRDRMLACHLTGNTTAVKTVLNELCEVVETNEPYDSLHPETLALYERLVGRRPLR